MATFAPRRMIFAAALGCALTAGIAASGRAQQPPTGLRRRMDAFAGALRDTEPMDSIAGFFPRQSAWEFVETPEQPGLVAPVTRRRRFSPGSTRAAISEGGPICGSFGGVTGDVGATEGALVAQAQRSERPWRYVGRLRFVPPGDHAGSPIYVEWTRENGAWVVSRIGDAYWYFPRLIGEPTEPRVTRDTTAGRDLPMERRYATAAGWFRDSAPLGGVRASRFIKYGLPRALGDDELERYGSVGAVPVFAERGHADSPEVLYVLVGPGEYQPYSNFGHSICRD